MKKLKKVMGFDKRRVALEGETVGDYAVFGIKQMIADGVFKEEEIELSEEEKKMVEAFVEKIDLTNKCNTGTIQL